MHKIFKEGGDKQLMKIVDLGGSNLKLIETNGNFINWISDDDYILKEVEYLGNGQLTGARPIQLKNQQIS